jgi:hypothetical protein
MDETLEKELTAEQKPYPEDSVQPDPEIGIDDIFTY